SKSGLVDLYVIEKYQLQQKSQKELALFLASKVAKGTVVDATIHTKIEKYQRVSYNGHDFYYVSSNEMHNARQLILNDGILQTLYNLKNNSNKEISVNQLKETFVDLAEIVISSYNEFLPNSSKNVLND